MRTDITIDRKQVQIPLKNQTGYMRYKVQFGDIVFFDECGHRTVGRMIGRVAKGQDYPPPDGKGGSLKDYIVVACLGSDLSFTMERWVNPADVLAAYKPKPPYDLARKLGIFFSDEWLKQTPDQIRARLNIGDFFGDYKIRAKESEVVRVLRRVMRDLEHAYGGRNQMPAMEQGYYDEAYKAVTAYDAD